ncbi:MAG: glycosyltransferase [Luteolibacter sp.]
MKTDESFSKPLEGMAIFSTLDSGSEVGLECSSQSLGPPMKRVTFLSRIKWWMPAGVLLVVWTIFLFDTVLGADTAADPFAKWILTALFHLPYLLILGFLSCGLVERVGFFWKGRAAEVPGCLPETVPVVCIQLPMFNEHAVARRAIQAAAAVEWPRDRFIVQVLDDSTDPATAELVREICEEVRQTGVNCMLLQRTDRKGYKAGALEVGRKQVDAEFFAIFDADFMPPSDYLVRAMPFFFHENGEPDHQLALVQAQWGHLNDNESLLTGAQALWVDDHHTLQKAWRSAVMGFVNFTGTAGIWRGSAVEAVGGWRSESLVEDCELSFRILFGGYRTKFVKEIVVPAELPATYASYRLQQRRWTSGWVQLQRLHFRRLLFDYQTTFLRKAYLVYHMCISWQWPTWALWLALLPFLIANGYWLGESSMELGFLIYAAPALAYVVFAGVLATLETKKKYAGQHGDGAPEFSTRMVRLVPYIVINTGMFPHHLCAFLEGLFGPMHGVFERTPKAATVIAPTGGSASRHKPKPLSKRSGGLQIRGLYLTAEITYIITQLVWTTAFLAEGLVVAALGAGWLALCVAGIGVASYLPNLFTFESRPAGTSL